jgi:hypothetical protein
MKQLAYLVLLPMQAEHLQTQRAIFCPRTDNNIEHLKLNLADRNNINY